MASLQERLDAAFGGLAARSADEPAWKPTERPVFRSGPVEDGSSDEEFEERQRRESVPGLAQSLVEEDEPDAEGFRPSTAFCRQLDAEEEYSYIDEVATGMMARRAGDVLPPRDTQVLEDNIYEERARRRAAAAAAGPPAEQQPSSMEVEEPGAPPASAAADQQEAPSSGTTSEPGTAEKRRVRFEGVPEAAAPPAPHAGQPRQRGGRGGPSRVPDHVRHPERYTVYVLEEPLVVGGGVAQLADSQHNPRPDAAAAAEPEAERWEGPPGAIKFVPRQQRAGEGGGAAPAGDAAESGASSKKAAQQAASLHLLEDEGHAGEAAGAGDAAMRDAPAPSATAAGRAKRHYRPRRGAAEEAD